MTIKKTELKENISIIWEILTISKDCFEYAFYFHKPETQEEANYLNNSSDFRFIRHTLWRMTIIELSKLFSKSKNRDKFNLKHFINKLKKDEYFGDIGILNNRIENWEKILEENNILIENILTLRDKIYAHRDQKKEDFKTIEITFQEIEILIKLSEEIIKEIYSVVFDSYAEITPVYFKRNRFNMIKVLAEEKKNRLNRFKKENLS